MRCIAGGITDEKHTFFPVITTETDYGTRRGDELLIYAGTNHSAGGVIDECRDRGIELVHTLQAKTVTSGPPRQAAFERMVAELASLIGRALSADGIILTLHGAMVAEDYPDAELEILERARAVTGPDFPIAVTLDFHANISPAMVVLATLAVCNDTHPHVDPAERASRLAHGATPFHIPHPSPPNPEAPGTAHPTAPSSLTPYRMTRVSTSCRHPRCSPLWCLPGVP